MITYTCYQLIWIYFLIYDDIFPHFFDILALVDIIFLFFPLVLQNKINLLLFFFFFNYGYFSISTYVNWCWHGPEEDVTSPNNGVTGSCKRVAPTWLLTTEFEPSRREVSSLNCESSLQHSLYLIHSHNENVKEMLLGISYHCYSKFHNIEATNNTNFCASSLESRSLRWDMFWAKNLRVIQCTEPSRSFSFPFMSIMTILGSKW